VEFPDRLDPQGHRVKPAKPAKKVYLDRRAKQAELAPADSLVPVD